MSIEHPGAQATVHAAGMPTSQRGDMRYVREMSLEDMLLENRVVFLAGPITPNLASLTMMRLLYLQSVQKDRDINLYINSPGGYVDQTLAIYDTIQFLNCDVATYCIGTAASGAAVILMAGAKGKRFMLPHSKIMLHQPSGGIGGQAEDIRLQAEEILKDKDELLDIMARHASVTKEKLQSETERDRWIRPDEAKEWGLVDEIVRDTTKDRRRIANPSSGGSGWSPPPPMSGSGPSGPSPGPSASPSGR